MSMPIVNILCWFQWWQSLKALSSSPGGNRHMRLLTFLCGIQYSTTYIWSIIGYKAYFWQCQALKWICFPVFVHYNFSMMAIFRAPSSIPFGDRRMRLLTFLYGIQRSTTLIWSIFGYNAYFWQHWGPKWIFFAIFVHYNISMMAIFKGL